MTTKNKAVVRIYGQEYAIVSDKDRDYIQKVSNFVDDKMKEIAGKNKKLSTAMVAVLASLNMAEEIFKEKEKLEEFEEKVKAPDEAVEALEGEIYNLKQLLRDRAFEIERLEKDIEKGTHAAQNMKLKAESLIEAVAAAEKDGEEKDASIARLDSKIEDLKNKLVESEVKLIQSRKELQEFMEAFEN